MTTKRDHGVQDDSAVLDIDVACTSLAVWVRLVGEMDISNAHRVHDAVDTLDLVRDQVLVLDLTELTFCDARGLGTLVQIHRSATGNGHQVTIHGACPQIIRLLEILGEDHILQPTRTRP